MLATAAFQVIRVKYFFLKNFIARKNLLYLPL